MAKKVVVELANRIPGSEPTPYANILDHAIMTSPDRIPVEARQRLAAILPEHFQA
jgi:hypothetical protein